jgi:exonuclease III
MSEDGSVLPNVSRSHGGTARVIGLPISLTRERAVSGICSMLNSEGFENLGAIEIIRKKSGEVHARLKRCSEQMFGLLRNWGQMLGARTKWESKGYRPPTREVGKDFTPKRFRVATWNINSLRGKRMLVIDAILRMRLSVVGLQETLVSGMDWPINITGFQVFCSEYDTSIPGARGVALAVSMSYNSYLVAATPFWVYVRILGVDDKPWHVLNVYIPHDKLGRRTARRTLKLKVNSILTKDPEALVLVMGDLNCGINRASTLFRSAEMMLVPMKGSTKTYHKRQKWSSLDHILVSLAGQATVGRTKVRRDIDESDHFPVVARIKSAKLKTKKVVVNMEGEQRLHLNRETLKSCAEPFVDDIEWRSWLDEIETTDWESLDRESVGLILDQYAEKWETTSHILLTKYDCLVEPKPPRKKTLPRRLRRLLGIKREKWAEYIWAAPENKVPKYKEYKEARKNVNHALAEYLSVRWTKFIQKGSEMFTDNNVRKFFQWVDKITKYKGRNKSSVRPVADDEGIVQYESDSILELWAQHFEKLLRGGIHENKDALHWDSVCELEQLDPLPNMDSEISWEEIIEVIEKLRCYKAPGRSGLLPEFYKLLLHVEEGDSTTDPETPMQKVFFHMVNLMWNNGLVPPRWLIDKLVTIGKKGDLSQRDNYRGIALIELFVKIITKVAAKRLADGLEQENRLVPEQAGFRTRQECVAQVYTLMEVVRRRQLRKLDTIVLFIDFKKAYDVVPRLALLSKLETIGAGGKVLDFLRALLGTSWIEVQVGGLTSRIIEVLRGCRQGCGSSPISFDVFINDLAIALREVGVEIPGVAETLASLLFADDLSCIVSSVEQLQRACEIIEDWCETWEMDIGINKCGIMVLGDGGLKEEVLGALDVGLITIQDQIPPYVGEYEYLGILLSETNFNDLSKHKDQRIAKFRTRWKRLEPFLRTHSIPIKSRIRVLNTICLPVLRWGAELLGPAEKDIRDMETEYSTAIKCIVGSRSKNTIYGIASLRWELKIPSFHEMVIRSRLRIFDKYPSLNTFVSKITTVPELRGGLSGFEKTRRWFLRMLKMDIRNVLPDKEISQYFENKEASSKNITVSLKRYVSCNFKNTRSYLDDAASRAGLAKGVTWLIRARSNAIWTAKRAAKLNMVDDDLADKCPACLNVLGAARSELSHILLECQCYEPHRAVLGPLVNRMPVPLDLEIKCVILLGGKIADHPTEYWTSLQWSGKRGKVFPGSSLPGYTMVAEFLAKVMVQHMTSLWDYAVVD